MRRKPHENGSHGNIAWIGPEREHSIHLTNFPMKEWNSGSLFWSDRSQRRLPCPTQNAEYSLEQNFLSTRFTEATNSTMTKSTSGGTPNHKLKNPRSIHILDLLLLYRKAWKQAPTYAENNPRENGHPQRLHVLLLHPSLNRWNGPPNVHKRYQITKNLDKESAPQGFL